MPVSHDSWVAQFWSYVMFVLVWCGFCLCLRCRFSSDVGLLGEMREGRNASSLEEGIPIFLLRKAEFCHWTECEKKIRIDDRIGSLAKQFLRQLSFAGFPKHDQLEYKKISYFRVM